MISFTCPSCRMNIERADDEAGQKINCPLCGQRLKVPQPPPPSKDKTVLGQVQAATPQRTLLGELTESPSSTPEPTTAPNPPASAGWFVAQNGKQSGPFTASQLQEMAADGRLQPDDLVTKTGSQQWKPAQQVKGLAFAQVEQPNLPPVPVQNPPRPVTEPQTPPSSLNSVGLVVGCLGIGISFLVCLGIGAILWIGQPDKRTFATVPVGQDPVRTGKEPTEAEARAQLQKALDAWKDMVWQSNMGYRDIEFVDSDHTDQFWLYRFDISAATRYSSLRRWTFDTSLVFKLKDSDTAVRYRRLYRVDEPDERGVWRITVASPGVREPVR